MKSKRIAYYSITLLVTLGVQVTAWLLINGETGGDQLRYLDQASRIMAGLELYENGRIINPPLLPLILAAAQQIGIQVDYLPVLSIFSIAIATLVLFKLLTGFCSPGVACITALLLPLHPAVIGIGSQLMSEPYAILFGALSALSIRNIFFQKHLSFLSILALAALLSGMAMLKPLFGYTLLAALVLSLLFGCFTQKEQRIFFFTMSASCCIALIFCTPFLIFTYLQTGHVFKWSSGTGDHMYWMSIGGEDVWGSWVPDNKVNDIPFLVENGYAEEINSTLQLTRPERDLFLQSLARERIAAEPGYFIRNIIANAARVLFNYPYSFRPQSLYTYGYILPNMMMYLSLVLSFTLLPLTWRHQDIRQVWLLVFFLIYLGGNILVGSTGRQGLVLITPVLLWLCYQIRILIDLGILNIRVNGPNYLSSRS